MDGTINLCKTQDAIQQARVILYAALTDFMAAIAYYHHHDSRSDAISFSVLQDTFDRLSAAVDDIRMLLQVWTVSNSRFGPECSEMVQKIEDQILRNCYKLLLDA